MYKNTTIIAEVKTSSPFGWTSTQSWDELFETANNVGDILSIHTDKRWNGSFDLLKKARSRTNKPILAKGIHNSDDDITKALSMGADMVLVVGRTPRIHAEKCLIEPYTFSELSALDPSTKAVWNSRDLSDGSFKKDTFTKAREEFPGWLCQASNITSIDDVHTKADAVLVGTHLIEFAQSLNQLITS